jgi:hypothetical protein
MAYFEFMQTTIMTLALSKECLIGHKHFTTQTLDPVIAVEAKVENCFVEHFIALISTHHFIHRH